MAPTEPGNEASESRGLDPSPPSAERISTSPRSPATVFLAVAVMAAAEAVFGWYLYLSRPPFPSIDDEGYLMVMVRQWIDGNALYDEVYSQYGPFPMVLFGLPLRLAGVDLTHAVGRVMTLTLVVATAVVLAGVAWVLTRNLGATLVTQLGTFMVLESQSLSSMHPGALLTLLLALLLLNMTALRPRAPLASDALTGALLAAMILTKVNVGLFALLAVAYLVARAWPADRTRRVLLALSELALVLLGPVLLLRFIPRLDEVRNITDAKPSQLMYWSVTYVVLAVAIFYFARLGETEGPTSSTPFALSRLAIGFVAVVAIAAGVVLATGTTVVALVDNVLVRPLYAGDALTALPRFKATSLLWLLALPALLLFGRRVVRAPTIRAWVMFSAAVRVVGGFALLGAVVFSKIDQTTFFEGTVRLEYLPLVALVLVPRVGQASAARSTARLFLAVLCLAQSLQAFPVAGLQLDLGLLLPVVAGAVILDDGGRELAAVIDGEAIRWGPRLLAAAPAIVFLMALFWFSADDMAGWRRDYDNGVALGLPSTAGLHVSPGSAATLHAALDQLDDCDQFVMYPAWNSFYLFTDTRPPTGFNATLWEDLLDDDEQRAVVDALESFDGRVCYLRQASVEANSPEQQPLLVYLSDFVPVSDDGLVEMLVRPD